VYAARRLSDDTEWAVKIVRRELSAEHRMALRARAGQSGQVSHPGVLPVIEIGDRDGLTWLVMPRVYGLDLRRLLLVDGPLPPREAAELIGDVADAVTAVHDAGLVHRDIKPANVLVRTNTIRRGVVLTDLGIAAPLPGTEAGDSLFSVHTATGELDWADTKPGDDRVSPVPAGAGTLAYMPPEQWRGESTTIHGDVYSLGGTLYTALTGRRPFEQSTLAALAYAISTLEPPRPSEFGVPPAFDWVVATALAKNPAERFPDVPAFSAALRDAAAGRLPEKRGPWRGLRSRWLIGAGLVLMLGLLAAVLWWTNARPAARLAPTGSTAVVNVAVCAPDLTLWDRPGGGGHVVRTLTLGDRVAIDRGNDRNGWSYAVTSDGASGWVLNHFLEGSCH
jgi:serine/threonine-protein kinase